MYKIDLKQIKEWTLKGISQETADTILKFDPDQRGKLPAVNKPLSGEDLLKVLRVPPAPGEKVFKSNQHEHNEDFFEFVNEDAWDFSEEATSPETGKPS